MTTDQINRAMAELEGYKVICASPEQLGHGADEFPWRLISPSGRQVGTWWQTKDGALSHGIPDYTTDLNAVHRVEERLFIAESQWAKYGYQLQETIRRYAVGVVPYYERDLASIGKLAHATALQRCEAILRVMGKWEESQ